MAKFTFLGRTLKMSAVKLSKTRSIFGKSVNNLNIEMKRNVFRNQEMCTLHFTTLVITRLEVEEGRATPPSHLPCVSLPTSLCKKYRARPKLGYKDAFKKHLEETARTHPARWILIESRPDQCDTGQVKEAKSNQHLFSKCHLLNLYIHLSAVSTVYECFEINPFSLQ